MAGIGIKLTKIFGKETVTTNLIGFGYSTMVTVAPMFVIIGNILLMSYFLRFDVTGYRGRNLFAATILYIFIFSLLSAAPYNAVISRYLSDVIYDETYDDILPCYYTGLCVTIITACILGIPFCFWEYIVGKVALYYVFTGFCGFIALVLVFYSMLYLSICKDYSKISIFFFLGMLVAFLLSFLFVKGYHMEVSYGMLLSLTIGFTLTAIMEMATIRRYFQRNNNSYAKVLGYFKRYWKLIAINFCYTLGLYVHNFVFWNTKLRMVVAKSFVMAPTYDVATCIAMFTNISATVIFIARIEMYFHERYKAYSEAVTGGRWMDVQNTKNRMFRQLSTELMNLVRLQFIISVVIFLLMLIFLPRFGYAGLILQIYPSLAAGYFILFVMYSEIILLYYYNDLDGAVLTAFTFCLVTFLVSIVATHLSAIFYGLGVIVGALTGFVIAYLRLRWVEKHLDEHIFCRGVLFPTKLSKKPSALVFDRSREKAKDGIDEKAMS
ncbi:MAG: exopolysaccharide Pel transporter PelG [Lachnospiraceae bacterium]|nr:exopolysaccharide Pel transporter PelG [Lachnospiraceae bacterium]MBQ2101801.1 exopolysaccharide Pel transporter PelG [Lachnospiraceae bacterium]MBQ3907184.1 exopolysaccharide Pel transporter PelG [Lachnospiraceae bacterium]